MYLLLPLITRGGTQGPQLGSRDWREGNSLPPSHLPRGLRDKAPELVTWQRQGQGLHEPPRPPVTAWGAEVPLCLTLAREAAFWMESLESVLGSFRRNVFMAPH